MICWNEFLQRDVDKRCKVSLFASHHSSRLSCSKNGKEEAPVTLLISVTRVAVKIRHGHRFCFAQRHDILNYRRASRQLRLSQAVKEEKPRTIEWSCLNPLRGQESRKYRVAEDERDVRFPWIHKREGLVFHVLYIEPSKNQVAVTSCWMLRAVL